MPRLPRILYARAYYHVYNRGVEKRLIYLDHSDRRVFLSLLREYVISFRINLFAYCLMDNHFHFYLQTQTDNLDKFMHKLIGRYVQYFNSRYNRVGPLFQSRYKSKLVEADSQSLTLIKYIHNNPVVEGLAGIPEEYPWSSYQIYMGMRKDETWLNYKWVLDQFAETSTASTPQNLFKDFHQVPGGPGP